MIDYGTSLHVQLKAVLGNILQGKDLARLNIANFRFTSANTSRRFCYAKIIYKLRYSDLSDADPPGVPQIAPRGEFPMNPSGIDVAIGMEGSTTAGSGFGLAKVSLGLSRNLVETETKIDRARLAGFKKVLRGIVHRYRRRGGPCMRIHTIVLEF
jgi:hypothetical protein